MDRIDEYSRFSLTMEGRLTFKHAGSTFAMFLSKGEKSVAEVKSWLVFTKKEECSPYKAVEIKKIGKWKHMWGRRLNQLEFFGMKNKGRFSKFDQ